MIRPFLADPTTRSSPAAKLAYAAWRNQVSYWGVALESDHGEAQAHMTDLGGSGASVEWCAAWNVHTQRVHSRAAGIGRGAKSPPHGGENG